MLIFTLNILSKHIERYHHCMWFNETFWLWHSLYRSMVSSSWRTSPVMWNTAGVSMMGGGHTASWVFCRGEPEPMPGADRTNQGRAQASSMHVNQPVRGAWVEGICRGSLPWIRQQSHNITWAGKPSVRNVVSWHRLHEASWPSVTSPPIRTVKGCRVRKQNYFLFVFFGCLVAKAPFARLMSEYKTEYFPFHSQNKLGRQQEHWVWKM